MHKVLVVAFIVVTGGLVLLVDPAGLFSSGDTFHYGAAEMRAAVEGTWELYSPDGTIAFTLRQSAHELHQQVLGELRVEAEVDAIGLVRNVSVWGRDMPFTLVRTKR